MTEGARPQGTSWRHWRTDLPASLVVFLVALPLCMGISMACGLPASAGIITGIIGGIVVGSISGAPLQVSGPAAGLIVLVGDIVARRPSDLGLILVLAGGLQVLAGVFRLAQWFRAVSPAVIQGMLAGIGALILLGQLHVVVGHLPVQGEARHPASGLDNLLSLPECLVSFVLPSADGDLPYAAFIGLLTLTLMMLWDEHVKKKLPVPGSLVAVVLASLVCAWMSFSVACLELPDSLVCLPALSSLTSLLDGQTYVLALAIALIASAESLLCATAVDQLHKGPRTRYDRELAAQGVGNVLCGLLGGLPMTGVIVRSGANISAGAQSRLSAILHGVWLLGFVTLLPHLLSYVPVASLAAILIHTGVKLINIKAIRDLWKVGKGEVFIYAATFGTIVVTELLTGVIVGIVLSAGRLLLMFAHISVRREDSSDRKRTVIHVGGSATFLSLPKLATMLEQVPPGTEMHVRLERLQYIDHACFELIMNWAKRHEAAGGKLVIDWESLEGCFGRKMRLDRAHDLPGPLAREKVAGPIMSQDPL